LLQSSRHCWIGNTPEPRLMGIWSDGMPVIVLALSKSITALAAWRFRGERALLLDARASRLL
jgi:hypothetical protein